MHTDHWSDIAAHRERLLRIARRRCATREDAEDIVSEAMLRCATFEGLDNARIEQFLTAVTVRLCADAFRKSERCGRALVKLVSDPDVTPGPEDELLGGVDAEVLDALMASLPDRQRAVLFDRAHGLSVTQIASRHALTYKAAESALARARSAMRAALAGAFGAVAAFLRWVRPKRAAAAVALPAVTLVVVSAVLHTPAGDGRTDAVAPTVAPYVTAAARVRPAPAPPHLTPSPKTVRRETLAKNTPEKVVVTDPGYSVSEAIEKCASAGPYVEIEPTPGSNSLLQTGCGPSSPRDEGSL